MSADAMSSTYRSPARHVVRALSSPETARAEAARRRVDGLSARERHVLDLLGEGLSNADAGRRPHMSEAR